MSRLRARIRAAKRRDGALPIKKPASKYLQNLRERVSILFAKRAAARAVIAKAAIDKFVIEANK